MSEESPVLVEAREGIQIITINRPDQRNAINGDVARGIAAAVDELEESSELRVGVLTGAGGTFSAGMDLKSFLTGDLPVVDGRGLGGITQRPPRKPFIGAVEGWAVAGGFELLLACDLVVAAETAKFGVPEVKRALVAGAGAAMLLAQRIPQAIALELLLTGDPVSALRAAELGLVNRITAEGSALEGALELARTIAANGPLAVQVTKQIVRSARDWTFDEGWDEQAVLMEPVFSS
ncbi:MAG: crotonase/enoyl-CoA hydratase family protein, partial [Actinomycetes bacterium]